MPFFRLHIENPCSESWDEMSPREGGRHCKHCEKTVVDFTSLTDREISHLVSRGEKLCGRLRTDQLDRVYPLFREVTKPSAPYRHMAAGFLMAALILSSQPGNAQLNSQPAVDPAPIEMVDGIKRVEHIKLGQVTIDEDVKTPMHQVKGEIQGPYSPIINARVTIYTPTNYYEAYTDRSGHFVIEIPLSEIREKNVVEFNYERIVPFKDTTGIAGLPRTLKEVWKKHIDNDIQIIEKSTLNDNIVIKPLEKAIIVLSGKIEREDIESEPEYSYIVRGVPYNQSDINRALEGFGGVLSKEGLENKRQVWFHGEEADLLFGSEVEEGLCIFYDWKGR